MRWVFAIASYDAIVKMVQIEVLASAQISFTQTSLKMEKSEGSKTPHEVSCSWFYLEIVRSGPYRGRPRHMQLNRVFYLVATEVPDDLEDEMAMAPVRRLGGWFAEPYGLELLQAVGRLYFVFEGTPPFATVVERLRRLTQMQGYGELCMGFDHIRVSHGVS